MTELQGNKFIRQLLVLYLHTTFITGWPRGSPGEVPEEMQPPAEDQRWIWVVVLEEMKMGR